MGQHLVCEHCGATDKNVTVQIWRVSTGRNREIALCEDRTACRQRWNEANGFVVVEEAA